MANTISAFNPEYWAKSLQILHKKQAVYRNFANFRGEASLKDGDVYHRVLPSSTYVQNYTPGSDMTVQSLNATDGTLTVDKKIATLFQVDDVEKAQSAYDITAQYGKDAITNITNNMDADVLFEATNATSTIDAGDIGGTAGDGIDLSSSNVFSVMSKVFEKLGNENVELNKIFGNISPEEWSVINNQVGAKETSFGDTVTRNGFAGNMIRYNGIDQYMTNNYTTSQTLGLATNPTNGDTVVLTISVPKTQANPTGSVAITLTFVSTIGSTAGNVLIGGDVDTTRANMVALLNAPGTTSANQVGFTGETLAYLERRFSAVNDNTANTATIYYKGGKLAVSETLTDGTDAFDADKAIKHLLFGRKGAIDMITQIAPTVKGDPIPLQFGMYVKMLSLYGVKTFSDGADQLVCVKVKYTA
jgi:predicted GIY-YIG superfamily endonuclease